MLNILHLKLTGPLILRKYHPESVNPATFASLMALLLLCKQVHVSSRAKLTPKVQPFFSYYAGLFCTYNMLDYSGVHPRYISHLQVLLNNVL